MNTGRENNITYHPIMDNYPEYGNISRITLNENYAATVYAMTRRFSIILTYLIIINYKLYTGSSSGKSLQ